MLDEIALAQLVSLAEAESHESITLGEVVTELLDMINEDINRLKSLRDASISMLERLKQDVERLEVDISAGAD